MSSEIYSNYLFQVKGESIKHNPKTFFESNGVYLIIDKDLKLIWIWSGLKSKLFHRYIASNWAGKIRHQKKFYNFKFEVIKQGREPEAFNAIYNEINEGRTDLNYPGESRNFSFEIKDPNLERKRKIEKKLSNSEKSRIRKILSEITEMQMHIKYSMEHIVKKITQIEKILNS
ncbi:MAG: hypothetical protein ACFFAN_05820 [Promethearchaeota archaeon]